MQNRHLLDITRAILCHMHVTKHFLSDAVLTAYHLINRMHSSILDGVSHLSLLFSFLSIVLVISQYF